MFFNSSGSIVSVDINSARDINNSLLVVIKQVVKLLSKYTVTLDSNVLASALCGVGA